ncbi:MAG: hypothetical protein QXR30_04720 [Candidatus Woesearchaeota archaeon]
MIKLYQLKLKNLFLFFLIVNGILMVLGLILIKFTIIGLIILIFSLFSIIFSYYELKKFLHYENIKKSYSIDSIADFSNTLYELTYRKQK